MRRRQSVLPLGEHQVDAGPIRVVKADGFSHDLMDLDRSQLRAALAAMQRRPHRQEGCVRQD